MPVVKSYPQFSQNSASADAGAPQCGHVVVPAEAAGSGAGVGGAADAGVGAAMGAPHRSQ